MDRGAIAEWRGTGDGGGLLTSDSGALIGVPYAVPSRFEQQDRPSGSNPEELLAAAEAGCMAMSLAAQLDSAGHPATSIRCEARVHMIKPSGRWTIPTVQVHYEVVAPGLPPEDLMRLVARAKAASVISRVLAADIPVTASLV